MDKKQEVKDLTKEGRVDLDLGGYLYESLGLGINKLKDLSWTQCGIRGPSSP